MNDSPTPNITQLLVAWKQGDQDALAQVTPLVYCELHCLAHGYLAGERRGHVLQTTALVNEAFVRLIALTQENINSSLGRPSLPVIAIQRPEIYGFGDMVAADLLDSFQISDGATDFQNPVIRPR